MHLWPSLRIRDSFKHAYLHKFETNLAHMRRAQRQQQQERQPQPSGDGKEPLLADGTPRRSFAAGALDLAWDVAMFLSCWCCCLCCGAFGDEDDHLTAH